LLLLAAKFIPAESPADLFAYFSGRLHFPLYGLLADAYHPWAAPSKS
jgi:hypothetical protein